MWAQSQRKWPLTWAEHVSFMVLGIWLCGETPKLGTSRSFDSWTWVKSPLVHLSHPSPRLQHRRPKTTWLLLLNFSYTRN